MTLVIYYVLQLICTIRLVGFVYSLLFIGIQLICAIRHCGLKICSFVYSLLFIGIQLICTIRLVGLKICSFVYSLLFIGIQFCTLYIPGGYISIQSFEVTLCYRKIQLEEPSM